MASRRTHLLLISFLLLMCSADARKILTMEKAQTFTIVNANESVVLSAELPKRTTPARSSPSGRSHGSGVVNERLMIGRHLARVDRIMQSVPSPGVGH